MDVAAPSRSRRTVVLAVVGLALTAMVAIGIIAWPDALQRARKARDRGRTSDAVSAYREYLADHPDDQQVRIEFAECLAPLLPRQALALLQEVPAESSRSAAALQRYADIALKVQRDDLAQGALLELEQRGEQGFALQQSLAGIAFRAGDFEQALRRARAARDLQEDHVAPHLLIADALYELHRPAAMVQPLETALQQQPDLYHARWNLAFAYRYAGRPVEAEREVRRCLKQNAADASAWQLLAQIERDQGDEQASVEAVRRALELEPQNVDARILEAQWFVSKSEPERAYQSLKPLEQVAPQNRQLIALLARTAMLSDRPDEAARLQRLLSEQIEREINR